MTARPRQRPPEPSAAHRRMADAMFRPPARDPAPDTDNAWMGQLTLNPGGSIGGALTDAHGWTLDVLGNAETRDLLRLRLVVAVRGTLLPQMEDRGVRADLWDRASLTVDLTRGGDGAFVGVIVGNAWVLTLRGSRMGPGMLGLRMTIGAANAG